MDKIIAEKFLVCNYLKELSYNGKRYTRELDEFRGWIFTREEIGTVAYKQYEYLKGRNEEFIPFLRTELGYSEDDVSADKDMFDKHYDYIKRNYEVAMNQNFFRGGR